MDADEPELVSGIDLHGHVQKSAPHFFGFDVEFIRHIAARLTGDNR